MQSIIRAPTKAEARVITRAVAKKASIATATSMKAKAPIATRAAIKRRKLGVQ